MIYLIILLVLIVLYLFGTFIMFNTVSKRKSNKQLSVINESIEETLAPYQDKIDIGNLWMEKQNKEHIFIKSNDNLKLHGLLIKHPNPKGIFIEAHGYRSNVERDLYPSCFNYYKMGYSLLLIDQRASGKSEGKYITFGMRESEDIICWCKYVNDTFKLPIVLAGVSMGATSVMMSMKDLRADMRVKYIIADCGYNNAYKEVIYAINHYFHIPGIIFIFGINLWCRLIAKFSLKEKTVVDSIKNKRIPLLLIHGEKDDFVPPINSKIIHDAYKGRKELIICPEATHGISYLVDCKKYIEAIKKMIR